VSVIFALAKCALALPKLLFGAAKVQQNRLVLKQYIVLIGGFVAVATTLLRQFLSRFLTNNSEINY